MAFDFKQPKEDIQMDIPRDYFDFVYSIYGIGWTTDLDGTFQKKEKFGSNEPVK